MGRAFPKNEEVGMIKVLQNQIEDRAHPYYAVHGSPVQAVAHGVLEIAPKLPDLCVSGVNYGENVGGTLFISGTIGAALEASCYGVPALAISIGAKSSAPGNEWTPLDIVQIAADSGVDEVQFQLLSERKYEQFFAADIATESVQRAFAMASTFELPTSLYPLSDPSVTNLTSWFSMPLRRLQPDECYRGCTYIHNSVRIDPEGNVIPCLECKLGNILEEDLIDIWNGPNYQAFRRQLALYGLFQACLRCCSISHEGSTCNTHHVITGNLV
jgi:radical SAM protein with 4Fe4S-binding SPASM domain